MTSSPIVEEQRVVAASPEVVFTVLTSPGDLTGWLCNGACLDSKPGANFCLHWYQGYDVHGRIVKIERPKLVVMTWQGSGEPAPTEVTFTLTPVGDRTSVTVRQTGFGVGADWQSVIEQSRKGWSRSLENLQYLVETGMDLREARRPMIGINLGMEFDAARAAREDIVGQSGIYLEGVVPGLGAEAAGLRKGDVLTHLDGQPVSRYEDLPPILQRHAAGDRVEMTVVRGKEPFTATVELRPRPQPDIPSDPRALAAAVRDNQAKAYTAVAEAVAGASEEQAARPPAPGEWSAKEALAHLCVAERDYHFFLGEVIAGQDPFSSINSSIVPEKLAAVLAVAPTLPALLTRLAADQSETVALIAAIRPEIVANKGRYRRIGMIVQDMPEHVLEHAAQAQAAIAAAA